MIHIVKILNDLRSKGFFDLLSVKFLTQFLGFGSLLLVAKFLTPIEFGQIKIIQSYAALFILLAKFGFDTSVLKFCAEKRLKEEKAFILKSAMQRALFATTLALALLACLTLTGVIASSRELSLWLLIYAAGIPFAVLTGLLIVYLQALKRIRQMARAQAIIKLQSVVIIVVFTWVWGFKGFIFATIIAYIIGLLPLVKLVGLGFIKTDSIKTIPKHFMHIALFSLLANGVSMLGAYADMFILDHFSPNREAIGYYSLATIFILCATQVTGTVQFIATPYFSERGNDETWFRKKLVQTQTQMAALSIVVAVGVYALAWLMIQFFYEDSYIVTMNYLSVLLLNYIVFSSYAIIGVSLIGLGLIRYNFVTGVISTPMGLILSYFLLQQYGTIGVAWARVLTSVMTFILSLLISRIALRKYFRRVSFAS